MPNSRDGPSGAVIYERKEAKPNIAPPSAPTPAFVPIAEHACNDIPCSLELEHSVATDPPPAAATFATSDECCCPCEAEQEEVSCVDLSERWFSTLVVRGMEDA